MAMIDTPERRQRLLGMMWDLALRRVEGPDSQGAPLDPDAVFESFRALLRELGYELDVRPIDGEPATWPSEINGIPIDEITRAAAGLPPTPRVVADPD